MQGQRSFMQPFHDSFDFDHGSNSSSSGINRQILWNSMLFNPEEIQSMQNHIMSSGDAYMPCLSMANQDGAQLDIWSSGGSNYCPHSQNQDSCEENKLEHGWAPPATITSGGGPRIEDNRFGSSHVVSLENINIRHSTIRVDGIQSFPQNNSSSSSVHQNTEHAAGQVGVVNEFSETRLSHHPYTLDFLDPESIPPSTSFPNPGRSSSESVGFLQDDDGRPEFSLDGRRLSCKRKNIESFSGKSPASGNASSSHQDEHSFLHSGSCSYNPITSLNISNSSGNQSIAHSTEVCPAAFGTVIRGVASNCYPSSSEAGNAENSYRNYRMRINPAQSHDISPWLVNTVRQSDVWLSNQLPSHSISLNHSLQPSPVLTSISLQNQPHMPVTPGLSQIVYHFPWASNSRTGCSSGYINTDDRMIARREGSNSRNIPVTSNLDLVPTTDIRNMAQDQANWSLSSRRINMVPSSQAGTSAGLSGTNSGLHPTLGSTWLPHQNAPTQYSQPLLEPIHPSLFPSGSFESGGQGANFPLQHSGHSFTSQEVAQQIRASLHGPQPASHVRSVNLMRRRNGGLLGAPSTMRSLTAAGEQRSRMLSEIRRALESLRQEDNLQFETLILAGSDLHDRHRDMRLDVDNLSYEELLALEEHIGNVSTGLSKETILKCLNQRKYSPTASGTPMENEPCSICQEDYAEGEDLGTLDCGHDFHTHCIKQWLLHKNLCPICKNTALVT